MFDKSWDSPWRNSALTASRTAILRSTSDLAMKTAAPFQHTKTLNYLYAYYPNCTPGSFKKRFQAKIQSL
jgi:hypothetical protein